jgi:hypothetical protein
MADTKMRRRLGRLLVHPHGLIPVHEMSTIHLNPTDEHTLRRNKTGAWPRPRENPSPFPPLGRARREPEREKGVGAVATAAAAPPSVTPLADERVHPRVCASPSSGFATTPLGGGRSERIRRAGKVGCSGALPGTQCLRQRWIRCGGALGRLPSHHKRRHGALPVSGVYRSSSHGGRGKTHHPYP